MPRPKRGYTTTHRCATADSSKRNQPSETETDKLGQKLQDKTSGLQETFDGCVCLSIGPEAKRDIYNTFDPEKPFNIHLDPPSTTQPPLVKIVQEDKLPVYTMDFYFTNKSLSNVCPSGKNNNMPMAEQAAAVDLVLFDTDQLQPGKI